MCMDCAHKYDRLQRGRDNGGRPFYITIIAITISQGNNHITIMSPSRWRYISDNVEHWAGAIPIVSGQAAATATPGTIGF